MYDVIVVGGGPAGLTAASYARRGGMSVLILEITVCGGQIINSANVENFPSISSIPGWQLADNWQKQAEALGAEILTAQVSGIEPAGRSMLVHTAKGDFEGKAVIIATGVGHTKLSCPGAEKYSGRGVSTCATCDGAFFRGKEVAVIGGGNTAFEDAVYLSSLCSTVYLIHRRNEFRAGKTIIETAKSRENIKIMTPFTPVEIFGDESGRVCGISVRNTETGEELTLHTPGIFTAIGMHPDNERFKNVVSLDEYGYIKAGEDCRTETPGIFAAGDTRTKSLRQLVTAAADGAAAATAAVSYVNSLRADT